MRTSRDSLSVLVDASEQGSILIDTMGTVLAINQETARRLGLPREQIIGRSMMELLPPEVAARRREAGLKVIATGEPERFEDDWDGRTYAHSILPVKDGDGQVVRLAVFSRDVTEQRSREHALRESQAKYRILFESTSDGMFLTNPDGSVQDANPAACELLGRSVNEIREAGRAGIVHMDERFHAAIEERACTGRFAGELTYVRGDGTLFPVEVESVLFPQGNGPLWAFTIFRDISERRQAQFERDTTVAFLEMVNASVGTHMLAEAAAAFFKEQSGCESVGIRLEASGGYPYAATRGLPAGLAGQGDGSGGGIGCAVLECLCGKVIRNELGPAHPLRTRTGGFWTNHASGLLGGGPDAPGCMLAPGRRRAGLESLALLPLAVGDRRLGLLELSDSRANRLTPALIPLWETLANHLAVALAKTQAEEALRASDSRYRRIVETAREGVWETDVEGRTVYVNRRMVEIAGCDSQEDMVGRPVASFLFPEDVPGYLAQVEARRRGEAGDYELRGRRKDGSEAWILISASPIVDEGGRYAGAFAMVTDITARKRAEEASRQFEKLASGSLDALCLLGRDYVYRAANDAMLKRVGRPREEVVGRHIADILGAEAFASTLRPRLDAALQGEVVAFAEWFSYPEVGRRFMEVTYAPYRELDGSISGIVAQARDVSERKRSEEILQARLRLSELAATLSLDQLLQNALGEAERLTGSLIGFFHMVDEDHRVFSRQTWSAGALADCRAESRGLHFNVDEAGVWADCVRERRPVIHNDYPTLPHRRGLPQGHPPVARELVVPIVRRNRVVAVMGVGNKEAPYDLHDVAVVSNLSDLLWDIILRKQAEEKSALQALVLDQAQDRVTIIGLDGVIRYVNRAQCRGFKCREDDLVGKPFYTLGDDPTRGGNQAELIRSTLRRGEWRGEILHRASDGSENLVDCRTFLVRDADSKPLAICGIGTDITERKRMEAALRESEARYRALVEGAPVPILVIQEGRCSYANPAALKLIGASDVSQVNRVPVTDMIAPEYREAIAERLQMIGEADANAPFEYEVLRMDGARVAVESISMPIVFGGKRAALAIGQDISSRKQAECEQREQHRRLQNAREEERRRIAREVHDELGQSLTGLKIDLAWVRSKVIGLDERIAEKVDSMDRQVAETLSAVQRISSELRPGILDALGLSAAVEWLVRDFEKRTDIRCQLSIEPEEISVGATPAIDIFRILQESLTNVARHSKASSVRVRLHLTEKDVQLLVVDNGVGISDEHVSSRESIGLIGMRERVQVSGGSLRIHGLPGEGTLVRAAIPL